MIFSLASMWIFNLTSCLPEGALNNIIVTEDLLYISGERIRITGRLIEVDGNVDDHGFHIAKNPDFSAPIVISLGPKENGLGRFIGEYELLEINTVYYFRSYANIAGNEVHGQTKQFSSLIPRIDSYHPRTGLAGTIIAIEGVNFTNGTRVMLGDIEMVVISIKEESLIEVRVPPIGNVAVVDLVVEVQDTSMVFADQFSYNFGHWELETTFFNNLQLYNTMWLKDGNEFIFGLGAEENYDRNLNIWSLDLTNNTWTDLNFSGSTQTRSPFNSNGYWGAGIESREFSAKVLSSAFWRYSAGVFEMKQSLPFTTNRSVSLSLNGVLYVFGGFNENFSPIHAVHQYQEGLDSWLPILNAPIEISSDYPSFAHNNIAYFIMPDDVIWQYDPITNEWLTAGLFPGNLRQFGATVTLNGKAYIGIFTTGAEVWEWDIINNVWIEKSPFPGAVRDINVGYFSHNNKAYFFRSKFNGGQFEQDPKMELWSLDPTRIN